MAKIPFGATITAKVKWFGDARLAEIQQRASVGVVKATNVYAKSLSATLRKNIGSVPFSAQFQSQEVFVSQRIGGRGRNTITASNLRVRIRHSPPGRVPFAQTFNLANSIKTSFNFRRSVGFSKLKNPRTFSIRSRISSDVPYSKTLELGGALSIPQGQKKHTSIRLINPLRGPVTIAKRPAWLPLFERLHPRMIGIVAKEMRRGSGSVSLSGKFEIT